ncbi:MAG TPA: hypothetical protein VKW08_09100 [Xanthobacteraceae bacterium]|nr:hypothetical protein [Xanthobacteraceae bacterium]
MAPGLDEARAISTGAASLDRCFLDETDRWPAEFARFSVSATLVATCCIVIVSADGGAGVIDSG